MNRSIALSVLISLGLLVSFPLSTLAFDGASGEAEPAHVGGDGVAEALQLLKSGQFAEAEKVLRGLAETASDSDARALLLSLSEMARAWHQAGLRLVPGNAEVDQALSRLERHRTSGEIAGLYVDSALYGAGTGLWLSFMLEMNNAAGVLLPMVGLSALGAGGVYFLDNPRLGYGVPRSASAGLRLGFAQGLNWVIWYEASSTDGNDGKVNMSILWGAATAGLVGGGYLGHALGATPGAASMVESGGLWVSLLSGLLSNGFGANRTEDFMLASAIGLNVGAVGAGFLAADAAPSAARVRYLDLGAILGGITFGGIYAATPSPSARVGNLVTAAGIGGGWRQPGS